MPHPVLTMGFLLPSPEVAMLPQPETKTSPCPTLSAREEPKSQVESCMTPTGIYSIRIRINTEF